MTWKVFLEGFFTVKKAMCLQSYAISQTVFEYSLKTVKREEEKKLAVLVLFKQKSALLDFISNMLFCCQPFCICYIMGLDNIIGQCPL